MDFEKRMQTYISQVEACLANDLDRITKGGQPRLAEAMRYSALAGGKRLRPVLTLEFCRVSGGEPSQALAFACALEMIHTYSLIHDDLPCMDDDDLRRGRPTNHKVYGEATAVLAGDALLTRAFELAADAAAHHTLPPNIALQAMHVLAHEAGALGMIGGQILDLEGEHKSLGCEELIRLQELKTGALIRAAARMGCLIGGASSAQLQAAAVYADRLGLAFQIEDDLLDIEGDERTFGKPIGSDAASGKSTFPGLLGHAACRAKIRSLTDEAIAALEAFEDHAFLASLADRLVTRNK